MGSSSPHPIGGDTWLISYRPPLQPNDLKTETTRASVWYKLPCRFTKVSPLWLWGGISHWEALINTRSLRRNMKRVLVGKMSNNGYVKHDNKRHTPWNARMRILPIPHLPSVMESKVQQMCRRNIVYFPHWTWWELGPTNQTILGSCLPPLSSPKKKWHGLLTWRRNPRKVNDGGQTGCLPAHQSRQGKQGPVNPHIRAVCPRSVQNCAKYHAYSYYFSVAGEG